jgi:hypothetical protein
MTQPAHIARELVLPWPARELHPNHRAHWSKRAKAAKGAREHAFILSREAGWRELYFPPGPIHVWIDGYAADRRRRDADGLLSSLKPHLDGIADSLGIDDRRFVPHPWIKEEVRRPAEVRIRLTTGPIADAA